MVGASFNSVGAEALDIQDITLVGDDADGTAWIKWWDPATRTYSAKAVYVANFYDPETDEDLDYGGWGDNDWAPVEKTFAPGEGFWFSPEKDGVGVTTAGAVEKTSNQYVGRIVEKAGQQIMVINAFPTALDIQKIVLDGDAAVGGSWIIDAAIKYVDSLFVKETPIRVALATASQNVFFQNLPIHASRP